MSQTGTAPAPAAATQAPTNGAAKPGTQAPAKPEPGAAPPTPAEVKKLKLKIDGKDVELPESEVIARAQRESSSAKRFQDASDLSRKAQEIIKQADEDPQGFFSKRGKNIREWAENFLMEELKREQMSPEQKKAHENEEKLRVFEKERKDAADKKLRDEQDEVRKKHHDRYDGLFQEALAKAGLPKTAFTVKRMAELQLVNLKKKLDLTADQLVKVVREDYIAEQKSLFGAMEGDQMLELLGPDIIKKLSKAQISKLKSKGARPNASTGNQPRVSDDGRPPGMSDWRWYQLKNRRRA